MTDQCVRDHYNKASAVLRRRKGIIFCMGVRSVSFVVLLVSVCWAGDLLSRVSARAVPPPLEERLDDSGDEAPTGQYALGLELYARDCKGCHVLIPAVVFPSDTWREVLSETYHYGTRIELPTGPERLLVWQYLRDYSRSLTVGEETPLRFSQSRYFRALHPKVPLPKEISVRSCAQCHPGVSEDNFRRLASEWLR